MREHEAVFSPVGIFGCGACPKAVETRVSTCGNGVSLKARITLKCIRALMGIRGRIDLFYPLLFVDNSMGRLYTPTGSVYGVQKRGKSLRSRNYPNSFDI
jgi:hypothetical protein